MPDYPDLLPIPPVSRPVDGTVRVPGSKSITNRALLLAALAEGHSTIEGALFSDDTRYMAAALGRLGIGIRADAAAQRYEVDGTGGRIPATTADLFIGNAGTAARFLCAYLTLGSGRYRLDGIPRMRQRPMAELLDALGQLGARVDAEHEPGCLPVIVHAHGLEGGDASIRADASSQFLTALLMVAPLAHRGVGIRVVGELISRPYIEITLAMMRQWGVSVDSDADLHSFKIAGGQAYRARPYDVEPDASSASYFFAAAAATGGCVRVAGLGREPLQGDVAFADVLEGMGCRVDRGPDYTEVRGPERLRGVDVDMNAISDTVMTLAAIAPFASSPTTIRNVAHIRLKESDRIGALAAELGRLGVRVEERPDGLTIHPATSLNPAAVDTYDDHRMAMSFAVAGLKAPGISLRDPGCVSKTFPGFFECLDALCAPARGNP